MKQQQRKAIERRIAQVRRDAARLRTTSRRLVALSPADEPWGATLARAELALGLAIDQLVAAQADVRPGTRLLPFAILGEIEREPPPTAAVSGAAGQ